MGKPFFFFVVLAIFFLPIVLEGNLYYDVHRKKCIFSLRLYRRIPIAGGYLATYVGGLAFHVSEKRAVLLPYAEWKEEQKRISVLKLFRLRSLRAQIETNADWLIPMIWIHHLLGLVLRIANSERAEIKNSLWLRENKENIALSVQTVVWTNIAKLLVAGVKIMKEKVESIWKKKFAN